MKNSSKNISNAWLSALVLVVGLYLACTLIANIASLRIVIFAGFSIDAGTLIYPLTFTLRDLIHKIGGTQTLIHLVITIIVQVVTGLGEPRCTKRSRVIAIFVVVHEAIRGRTSQSGG